jgi:hypothetical protein
MERVQVEQLKCGGLTEDSRDPQEGPGPYDQLD